MTGDHPLEPIRRRIWNARLPLEIRIAASECRTYDQVDPYLVAFPRLAYLPSLLPRLLAFFSPYLIADATAVPADSGCFVYDSVPLKWHFPTGLLYDIHVLSTEQIQSQTLSRRDEPFRLTVYFSSPPTIALQNILPTSERALNDAFINSVKEADFFRSGTGKPIMSLSAADSQALWSSTRGNDLSTFARIHDRLLPSPGQLRNIPLRLYIPSSSDKESGDAQIKVLQGQFSPTITATMSTVGSVMRAPGGGQAQTLGTALHSLIPTLFPSRRTPILARPLLHGAQVPMIASLEELARYCCYADGWINIVIAMTT